MNSNPGYDMLTRNKYWIGILAGILFSIVAEGFIFAVNFTLNVILDVPYLELKKMLFAAAALNILPVRYFYVSKSFERTGGGILLITLVMVILVVILL